ncbi:MAG: serine hydrolase, partial [Solirubrobacterales bacterium]|nr:serine hydrolase [Solirubrobacterales bacterium]
WAGLPNIYFWIDRSSGIGCFWAVQLFPFADPTGVGGFLDLQSAVYAALPARATA